MSSQSLLEKCCLVGYPVAGNPTHYMIEQAIRQAGSDWRFLTFEVQPERLEDAIRGLRALEFRGAKIIAPHREAVMGLVDEHTAHAKLAGWANCLTLDGDILKAENTLGQALVELVGEPSGKHITLLGSGRTARAIGTAYGIAGAAEVTIIDQDDEATAGIVKAINDETPAEARSLPWSDMLSLSAECGVLVDATQPEVSVSLEANSLRSEVVVCDVTVDPPRTKLLKLAGEKECCFIDGLSLLVEQTALALWTWSGIVADRVAMREAVEEFLGV